MTHIENILKNGHARACHQNENVSGDVGLLHQEGSEAVSLHRPWGGPLMPWRLQSLSEEVASTSRSQGLSFLFQRTSKWGFLKGVIYGIRVRLKQY